MLTDRCLPSLLVELELELELPPFPLALTELCAETCPELRDED
jgi:hypothetical protein